MKMEETECSETSAYKIQTSGNYPEESIQHSEHGESLKLRKIKFGNFFFKFLTGFLHMDQLCVEKFQTSDNGWTEKNTKR